MKNTARAWPGTSCSRNEAAELRSPESEAEGLLNWAAREWIVATGALIGTGRQAQGASLRRPRCRRRMGTMSGIKARVRCGTTANSQAHSLFGGLLGLEMLLLGRGLAGQRSSRCLDAAADNGG